MAFRQQTQGRVILGDGEGRNAGKRTHESWKSIDLELVFPPGFNSAIIFLLFFFLFCGGKRNKNVEREERKVCELSVLTCCDSVRLSINLYAPGVLGF